MAIKKTGLDTARITPVLYRWKVLSDGNHPIMIRITAKGKRRYIATGYGCRPKEWDAKSSRIKATHTDSAKINLSLSQLVLSLDTEVFELNKREQKVTADRLSKALHPDQGPNVTVLKFWQAHITELRKAKKVGLAAVHRESMQRFQKFIRGNDIDFESIDITLLQKYAVAMQADGLKDTTIHLRFRDLRALYRKAASRRIVSMNEYPFGGRNEQPMKFWLGQFKTTTGKRAMSEDAIRKLLALEVDPVTSPGLFSAKKYFLLSYFTGGTPWVDLIQLKWKDIDFDQRLLKYERAKTKQNINVSLIPQALDILNHFAVFADPDPDNYVLPVLNIHVHRTPTQIRDRRKKVLDQVNRALKTFESQIGLPPGALTTYVARHTAATQAIRKGASTENIRNMLGHDNQKTTEIYIASLPRIDDTFGLLSID